MGKGDEGASDPTKKYGQVIYLGPDKAPEKLGCSDSLYFLDEACFSNFLEFDEFKS